jgi:hypothetical protein
LTSSFSISDPSQVLARRRVEARGLREEGLLGERRRLLRSGTIMEATIIAAPRSTKNAAAAGDPS